MYKNRSGKLLRCAAAIFAGAVIAAAPALNTSAASYIPAGHNSEYLDSLEQDVAAAMYLLESVLQDDYNEFFRACADAEQISKRLIGNYTKKYELKMEVDGVPEKDKEKDESMSQMENKSL